LIVFHIDAFLLTEKRDLSPSNSKKNRNKKRWKMEDRDCQCPICRTKAKFKELDTPSRRIFRCEKCIEFVISNFVINDHPNLESLVEQNSKQLVSYIKKFFNDNGRPLEIVLHEGLAKESHQISIQQIIDKSV